jgi:hypothetical protein
MRRIPKAGTDKTAAIKLSRDHRLRRGRLAGGIKTTSDGVSDALMGSSDNPGFSDWRHLVAVE